MNPTIKNIDAIAKAFKRKAADLLAPPLTAYPMPTAAPLRAEEIKADEYQVLIGYRQGSAETQELMRMLAARANEVRSAQQGSLARPRLRLIKG